MADALAEKVSFLEGACTGMREENDALAARLAEAERVLRICANFPPSGMRPQDKEGFFRGFIPTEQRVAREYFASRKADEIECPTCSHSFKPLTGAICPVCDRDASTPDQLTCPVCQTSTYGITKGTIACGRVDCPAVSR